MSPLSTETGLGDGLARDSGSALRLWELTLWWTCLRGGWLSNPGGRGGRGRLVSRRLVWCVWWKARAQKGLAGLFFCRQVHLPGDGAGRSGGFRDVRGWLLRPHAALDCPLPVGESLGQPYLSLGPLWSRCGCCLREEWHGRLDLTVPSR